LGAFFDLSSLPFGLARVIVSPDRVEKLWDAIHSVIKSHGLGPAQAGQLFGQLGFTCSQFFGRWGRAKLRPFSRRQHEPYRFALNPQLLSALQWWGTNLALAPERSVFSTVRPRDLVITYSDGEGADAGVAIAAWSSTRVGDVPLAGFMEIPTEIRLLWASQRARAEAAHATGEVDFHDIMEIEGIAPLLILHNWPWLVKDALWIHFIDNNSALGALVKGSSSVCQKDIIVGHTWAQIAQLGVYPWFDRVDTHSNPVDGLSRKNFSGDWSWTSIEFPENVINDLRVASSWD